MKVRYTADPRAIRIAAAARSLDDLRDSWLNPPELVERVPEVGGQYPDRIIARSSEAEVALKERTLTDLYNAPPLWLQAAHSDIDAAVAAAYGWAWPLSKDEILSKLFELNQLRGRQLPTASTSGKKASKRSPAQRELV